MLKKRAFFLTACVCASSIVMGQAVTNLNITPSASVRSWCRTTNPLGEKVDHKDFNSTAADSSDIGLSWWDARDIHSVEVVYDTRATDSRATNARATNRSSGLPVVQYWQHTWPEDPPHMPTIEDQEDDPWQGRWITAATEVTTNNNTLLFTFKPLHSSENANADNLPGAVTYRRTLKVRLLYPGTHPRIRTINAFSVSGEVNSSIRIELGCNKSNRTGANAGADGTLEIFNGRLIKISPWHWESGDKRQGANAWKLNLNGKPKGIIAELRSARMTLPGSNDETVVTLRSSQGTFSFSMEDLEKGPVYIPYFNALITKSDDPAAFSGTGAASGTGIAAGSTVREMIRDQPEQTYDRARKEIPHLDPVHDQHGNRIYLPLAADASWQKFAVEWGGNIFMNKRLVKAQGKELARCNWNGDNLAWKIGAGAEPVFDRTEDNCQMSILDDYLPIANAAWRQDGLTYDEETFTTLLEGPLSPSDPGRSEQTPAILMVKLRVSNPSLHADTAQIWLSGNGALNDLTIDGDFLMDRVRGKEYVRCYMPSPKRDDKLVHRQVLRRVPLAANSSKVLYFYFPFVGDLAAGDQQKIASLDYDTERQRVATYWRDLVAGQAIYNVPERKFNEMSRAVIPHIRMSATKDPQSGLYMVPASSLDYGVFANEAIYQTMLLDRLGDFATASDYLNTFMELQGSRKLPGAFTGDQKDVFYGVRVDSADDLTFNGYNMHHGTVLWGLAYHYLYSGDREWLLKAAPHMIRAANWIIAQRKLTMRLDEKGNRVNEYGLLPAGDLEDPPDWRYWFANNAYACLGMETMAKAFAKAGLPQAGFFQAEAAAYHMDIRKSMERASELSPVVSLRNNTYVPYVPTRPYQRFRYFGSKKSSYYDRYNKGIHPNLRLSATREALYGPIVLIKAGLIDTEEPMAGWILDDWEDNLTLSTSLNLNTHGWVDDEYWFSRGGMVFQANLQNPVDTYLKRQETKAALRDLYNSFVACLYPDVNQQTEEYRMWGHGSGPFYKTPDEARVVNQVYDLLIMEKNNELWLGAGVPQRWLEPGQKVELMHSHTEFGELSYSLKAGKLPETIEGDLELPATACSKISLFVHAPFQKPIRAVTINGNTWKEWDAGIQSITIPQTSRQVHVTVSY